MAVAVVGLLVTILGALVGAVLAYGRNVQQVTTLANEVRELRTTCANTLERVGKMEGKLDAVRDFSGVVARGDRGG